ncbi:HTH CENPB-type domain-containing protein [Trichonephila clavipes]|nr:HTH CENPB-type domain-containing protein [Trichonephila clavipes]
MLTDNKIGTSVQAESDPVNDETDEDEDNNNKSSKSPSNAGVLETATEWYEQQSECCPTQLLLLKKIHFIPNVKKLRESEGKTGKVLLILDNAPCHPPVEILNAIDDDFSVMYLPPNVTTLVQPMDQGVNEKLKIIYRKQVLRILLLAEKEESVAAFAEPCSEKTKMYNDTAKNK